MSATILDPPAVAAVGHKELNIDSVAGGIYIKKDPGPDWGDAEIQAFIADQDVGAAMIDYRLPPRVITIPLVVKATTNAKFDELRSQLQAKASRINEEGAVLKRELPSGKVYYADVFEAKLHLSGDWFTEHRATDLNATLELKAQPDWYQDPVVEAISKGTGDLTKVFPNIKGNLPGRVELTIANESAVDQLAIAWAFRAKRYSSAETAKPVYEAEELTPLDTAAEITLGGASNGKAIRHNNLSTGWTPVASTNLKSSGAYLTHQGLYDVWVRVYSTSITSLPSLRLVSAVGDTVSVAEGPQYRVPGASSFYMVPLGQINLRTTPFGTHRWQGVIQAYGPAGGENISIDRIYFWSGEESSGIPRAPLAFLSPQAGYLLRDEFNQTAGALNNVPLAASSVSVTKNPGLVENVAGVGTKAWASPENAKARDGVYASVPSTEFGSSESNWLKATTYAAGIPETATITGIAVSVAMKASGAQGHLPQIALVKAGTIENAAGKVKSDGGNIFFEDVVRTYGGQTDMWGNTWTPAQVNAATFGAAIQSANSFGGVVYVDVVSITVYYLEGATKWATSGDAIDFSISTGHFIQRTEVSDASVVAGRYALAGGGTYGNVIVGINAFNNGGQTAALGLNDTIRGGVIARYVNENNWCMAFYQRLALSTGLEESVKIVRCVAAAELTLVTVQLPVTTASWGWRYVWLEVDTGGRALLWAQLSEGAKPQLMGVGFDTQLAAGNTLATGKVGVYDVKTGSVAALRAYDSFAVWTNTHDAAAFAGKSAMLATQGLHRVSVDGGGYAPIGYPGSDLPRIPVSGFEERPVELMAKVSRGAFDGTPDAGLDPFGAQLTYRPCWSAIPKE